MCTLREVSNRGNETEELGISPLDMDSNTLETYVTGLFGAADENGDGVLQPIELSQVLTESGFKLSATTVLDIVLAADVDENGVIEYDEFVAVVAEMMQQPVDSDTDSSDEEEEAAFEWSDLTDGQLDDYLRRLYFLADQNGDGVLQPQEYVKLMRLSGLSFSDEVILEVAQ